MFDLRRVNAAQSSGMQLGQGIHRPTHYLFGADGAVPHPLQMVGVTPMHQVHMPHEFHLPVASHGMTSVVNPSMSDHISGVKR